ncbi:MAG: acyl-CoA dehydrogenase, partial [Hyphomicrobiaceae bacterium]|nr:acyl-CoA dehydrogenase [Hyphomicrobiaceae bacterium]
KALYLPKLTSGEWTGTMNLTEPQAGSDLGALTAKAEPVGDGTYKIFGTKIFITYGDHELTDNIIHLVLARLPDAPPGTKGISLFLVPKKLVNEDGSLGERNDVVCTGLEEKLGIHASPTCVMTYGEKGGATGYLVGEENRGLATMFIMMNAARLAVGVQGVSVAERATQRAVEYANERRQGKALSGGGFPAPIVYHADVRRMLLTMQAMTQAARSICLVTARETDIARLAEDPQRQAKALVRVALLTPVAKAFSTDIGCEVASLGVQVHGGMGFVEETGAAQYYRDARILPIYEGTNGIQAIDLVTRKLPLSGGATVSAAIEDFRKIAVAVSEKNAAEFGATGDELERAVTALQEVTKHLLESGANDPAALLGAATPYLRLFGLTAGAALLARGALSAGTLEATVSARVFAEHWLTGAEGIARTILRGTAVIGADLADLRIA